MRDDQRIYVPSEVDLKLRLGIFRLLEAKYRPRLGDQSKFLSAGIFNWAFLEPPANEGAKRFLDTNKPLIEQEAMDVHLDPDLAVALSILYTFTLIQLGPKNPERSMNLAERAAELNIVISSAKELYATDDAVEFLAFIDQYASDLLRVNLPTNPT